MSIFFFQLRVLIFRKIRTSVVDEAGSLYPGPAVVKIIEDHRSIDRCFDYSLMSPASEKIFQHGQHGFRLTCSLADLSWIIE